MGVYAQLNAQAKTFKTPDSPLGSWLASKIQRAGQGGNVDPEVPSAAAGTDGVIVIGEDTVDHTAGTFTITVTIRQADGSEESFTTGNLDFDFTDAEIETAIDSAATTASITDWTNGDITVAAASTDLQGGDITLTFDGASVSERPVAVVIADESRTGGTSGAISQTTRGQTERAALGVLHALDVISGSVAEQDAATDASGFTKGDNRVSLPGNIVKALMREAAAEDANNSTYHSLEAVLFGAGNDQAPMVEERVPADNTAEG